MTKKLNFLIVCADFYKDIADVMIDKAILSHLKSSSDVTISTFNISLEPSLSVNVTNHSLDVNI